MTVNHMIHIVMMIKILISVPTYGLLCVTLLLHLGMASVALQMYIEDLLFCNVSP